MLNEFKVVQPTTPAEASTALAEYGESAKLYAGGAELLLLVRHGLVHTEVLIDIKKIERLRGVTQDGHGLRVGACLTHRELAINPAVRQDAPALAFAESQVANVRVRNQGTLGGNLCFNDPHSDPGTVLLIHDATVTLGSHRGERKLALSEFYVDMYATALEPDELLLEVNFFPLPAGMKSAYVRLHRYQRPTLGVAAATRIRNDTFEEARLAVGCVGPKAQRLPELEQKIIGAKPGEARRVIGEAKNYLRDLLKPVDDLLGSAAYKLYMTGVLLGDALEQSAGDNGRTA